MIQNDFQPSWPVSGSMCRQFWQFGFNAAGILTGLHINLGITLILASLSYFTDYYNKTCKHWRAFQTISNQTIGNLVSHVHDVVEWNKIFGKAEAISMLITSDFSQNATTWNFFGWCKPQVQCVHGNDQFESFLYHTDKGRNKLASLFSLSKLSFVAPNLGVVTYL